MKPLGLLLFVAISGVMVTVGTAQITTFPYTQNFDTTQPPALPAGWSSSQNRIPGTNDFTTSTTTPRSSPHSAGSTNATVSQSLQSPVFDFSGIYPDSLIFYLRRSGTHTARMLVEASLDSGATFTVQLGDSLRLTSPNAYVPVRLPLPSVLGTSRSVLFRWRIIGDPSGGSTATLRIDDITVSARRPADLELSSVRFLPTAPRELQPVDAVAKIQNVGQESAVNFSVEFYVDANNDSLPQPSELRAVVQSSGTLLPRDSVELTGNIGTFPASSQLVMTRLVYPPDGNPANNSRNVPLLIGYNPGSVVVNEIMYAPSGAEPEWVEVMNTRNEPLNIRNWLISDNIITAKRVISSSDVMIPPGGFVVLTRDSVALADVHPAIPSRVISVTGFPSLNNTGDAVIIYDQRSAIIDSTTYLPSWGGSSGSSLERIDHLSSSTLQANWGTSRDPVRSTPGRRNSIARRDNDLSLDSLRILTMHPVANIPFSIEFRYKNRGRTPSSEFTLQLFKDANGDSIPQASEFIADIVMAALLQPHDSAVATMDIAGIPAGTHLLIARLAYPPDEDTTNNIRFVRVTTGYEPGVVRINEIMYAPPTGMPEWVELYNSHSDSVDVNRWLIGNRSASSRYEVTTARVVIPPDSFLVITKDTALFRLSYASVKNVLQVSSLPTFLWSNNGDAVVLMDSRRLVMDSVHYVPQWGGSSGRSLERIDPVGNPHDSTNWASSVDTLGATPGRRNSNVLLDHDLRLVRMAADTAAPGGVMRIRAIVQNTGRLAASGFALHLFHDENKDSVAQESERILAQSFSGLLSWRDSIVVNVTWANPPPGIHQVIGEVRYSPDQRPANNRGLITVRAGFQRRSLLINEVMYAPLSGNAEYVEFFNAGDSDVDVAQWKFRDRAGTGSANEFRLSTITRIVHPGEMFVIASDSSVLRLYAGIPDPRLLSILNTSSLSLNNDGDDIVLLDPTGRTVDSLSYSTSWHNPNITDKSGRSLEKISPLLESDIARNWTTCVLQAGGTPGRANSVYTAAPVPRSTIAIAPNPFSPDGDGHEDAAIIRYQLPLTVSTLRVRVFDIVGRRVRMLANNEPAGPAGALVWDGLDDERNRVRTGIYILFLEALDDRGGIVETAKMSVVVAARL